MTSIFYLNTFVKGVITIFFFFFDEDTFASRLKQLRVNNSLTLEQLGLKIESTKATLANFENCNKKPSLDMLIKLADYFDVSLDYLVGRTNDPKLHTLNEK